MVSARLSICIPVYNFGRFIGDTLDSIIQQATNEVEIVVVDGGSTDNTQEVIRNRQTKFSRINYLRLEKRGGIDIDMAMTVKLARGEYCWLFGGDDIMVPGAIATILDELDFDYDLYLCEDIICTFEMKPLRKHRKLNMDNEMVFNLGNEKERIIYFENANTTAAFFSFCSVLIFKKNRWNECEQYETFNGTLWAHAARFFEMIKNGLTIKYIPKPLLYKRGDNDSFSGRGPVDRLGISINGYNRIANYFFGTSSREAFHIRRSLRAELTFRHVMNIKLEVTRANGLTEMKVLDELVRMRCSDFSITNVFFFKLYQIIPMSLYIVIKSIRARTKRKSQA